MRIPSANRARRYLAWLVAGAVWALATAWLALALQEEQIAPALLFPFAVGALFGWGWQASARRLAIRPRFWAFAACLAWGLLVVVAQDYIGHKHRVRLYDDEVRRQPALAALASGEQLRPCFSVYLAGKVRSRPLWYSADAGLTILGALAMTALGRRRSRPPGPSAN